MYGYVGILESRRGHQLPWIWSYKRLPATWHWVLESNSGSLEEEQYSSPEAPSSHLSTVLKLIPMYYCFNTLRVRQAVGANTQFGSRCLA